MPRYIDPEHADAEVRCLLCDNPMKSDNGCDGSCHYDEDLFNKIMEIIDKLSTIEAEPVIHCKDCEHFEPFAEGWNKCYVYGISVRPEGFCSTAERRTDV